MSLQLAGASGATLALTSAGLAAASGNINLSTGATALSYAINGKLLTKAQVTSFFGIEAGSGLNPAAPNSFVAVQPGQACAFAVIIDASGNYTVAQGPIVAAGDLCPLPAQPAGKLIVGAMKVRNNSYANSGNGYRPATDAHNASGMAAPVFTNLVGFTDPL